MFDCLSCCSLRRLIWRTANVRSHYLRVQCTSSMASLVQCCMLNRMYYIQCRAFCCKLSLFNLSAMYLRDARPYLRRFTLASCHQTIAISSNALLLFVDNHRFRLIISLVSTHLAHRLERQREAVATVWVQRNPP